MRNIFISFPYDETKYLKEKIKNLLSDFTIDYSEKEDRSDTTNENIWNKLYKRIKGSSITIVIHDPSLVNFKKKAKYDSNSYDKSERFHNSGWIYKEIVASLRSSQNNQINGIIYLIPDKYYKEIVSFDINHCRSIDSSKIPEIISKNRFNHKKSYKLNSSICCEDSYIDIIKESDFFNNSKKYIDEVYDKRTKQIKNEEYKIVNNLHLS